MAKAIQGAELIAGAVGLGALAFFTAGVASPALLGFLLSSSAALGLGGIAMEAGAIADALTSNRGTNVTTRQPAAARQIIYGNQRVGGVIVYSSTTGSHRDQYNFVIVLAGHECHAIQSLYLDGRLVHFDAGSAGHTNHNQVSFGGAADGGNHTGPNGQQYNFGGKVFCQAFQGDQLPTDFSTALQANDPNWAPRNGRTPSLTGCTYVYLKLEYSESTFPSLPEIRFSVFGKKVLDPRTGVTAYSDNWALIAADIIRDAQFGLGDDSINEEQLIAAANVCDELVPLASGDVEYRYRCHMHYDTSTAPSDALANMMSGAAGRLSRIGGEWFIWPAYWQGPSFSFDEKVLTGPVKWEPQRGLADRFNRVTGTYTAANFPYNIAGNAYDGNGFDSNGQQQDNFQFGFQPTNFPQYAKDPQHGYANDQYLAEDFGIILPREVSLTTVLSVTQSQRVAKIMLERNRQQGTGTLEMGMAAYQMQPCSVMNFSFPFLGWSDKVLEIAGTRFDVQAGGEQDAPALRASFDVAETAASVYEWSTTEEKNVYDVSVAPQGAGYMVGAPQNMALLSSAATAVTQPDGSVVPRIEVTWDTPEDAYVTRILARIRVSGASSWMDAGSVAATANQLFIGGVVAGQTYDVAIASQRANGGISAWVELDGFVTSLVLSAQSSDTGIGPGSMVGIGGSAAAVEFRPFAATIANRSLSYFPAGPQVVTGLQPKTKYYGYVVDASLAGGDLTGVATANPGDFRGKPGYYLIDSVVTPALSSSGSGGVYFPSNTEDLGDRTTQSPAQAYDGDTATFATVSGSFYQGAIFNGEQPDPVVSTGECLFEDFPAVQVASALTLSVDVEVEAFSTGAASGGGVSVRAKVGTSTTSMLTATGATGRATYTVAVPANTTLSDVTVSVEADPPSGTTGLPSKNRSASISANVYEISIS